MNYKMNLEERTISGFVDGLKEMEQTVYKILNTERYEYVIYSWNYGIELSDLFGEPVSYVCPELERRITEALMQDDRIESVNSFEFDTSKRKKITVKFTVNTIYGNLEKEVSYNV